MKKTYFSLDEDFNKIIANTLPDKKVLTIKPISTGWTNIVYEAYTDAGNYFFRFPRDEFWIRAIVKDYEFAKFIHGKTDFHTVKLELLYDEGRPYSLHKKIEGTPLDLKMNEMTPEQIKTVCADIAKFMYQLHNVDFQEDQIFEANDLGIILVDFLDELLESHIPAEKLAFWKYDEFNQKDHSVLVHGDFNASNILLNENDRLAAVLDFSFAGLGNPYFDVARIIERCPPCFKEVFIEEYENLTH